MTWKTMIPKTVGASLLALGLSTSLSLAADKTLYEDGSCGFTPDMITGIKARETPTLPEGSFPVDSNKAKNCTFHQWSWMMFLWLTQKVDGQLRFETMPTYEDVLAGKRVDGESEPTLAPRMEKSDKIGTLSPELWRFLPDNVPLKEVYQAGSSGLLIDQNGQPVYYAMHVSPEFWNFAVAKNQLQIPANLLKFPATEDFPVNAMEIKASWKVVGKNDDVSGLYTRKARLINMTNNPDGPGIVPTKPATFREATVALVGLHIAGVVENHPEMIWATFEYKKNSPTMAKNQAMDAPVSNNKGYLFYKTGTPASECNINNAKTLKVTDDKNQVMAPITQACLQFAYGGGTTENKANIQALNKNAPGIIKKLSLDPRLANYAEVGAIWFKKANALKPNDPLDINDYIGLDDPNKTNPNLVTGSIQLSNSTIETFTQKIQSENNCFKCHNTIQHFAPGVTTLPGKNVNISRILTNAYFFNQTIEDAKKR